MGADPVEPLIHNPAFVKGLFWGVIFSIPLWIGIIWGLFALFN